MKTLAASALLLALLVTAQAQRYSITDLGVLPTGFTATAVALNDKGQVTGTADRRDPFDFYFIDDHPFLRSNGQMQDLGGGYISGAKDINNRGQVAGFSIVGGDDLFEWPFLWSAGADGINLGSVGPLGLGGGSATAINDRGVIVGFQVDFYTETSTFPTIYQNGVMSNMGVGSDKYWASINILGQVLIAYGHIPFTTVPPLGDHIAIWQSGNLRAIPTLGGTHAYVYSTQALNDWGMVVGSSSLPGDNVSHAFVYANGKTYDLTPKDPGSTVGISINNLGLILGRDSGGIFVMPLWGKLRHISDMLDSSGSGWTGLTAVGINDRGQIAGSGTHNGLTRAFLLSPY